MNRRDEEKQIIFDSLKIALLQLMDKKDFSRITVKEIVTKAGVGRSTFYRHFPNKIDLVRFLIHDALINFDKNMLLKQSRNVLKIHT